jgi:hypothetical protein
MRKALADENMEDPECTFQPKISEKSQKIVSKKRPDFNERNNIWLEQKKENLKQKEETREDKEYLHCTFQPQLVRARSNQNPQARREQPAQTTAPVTDHTGVDKFLQRQEEARKEKLRKEVKLLGGGPKKTTHDPSKLTIPKNPNLSAYTRKDKKRQKSLNKDKDSVYNEEIEHQIEVSLLGNR